ncbi:hypothetical protein ACJMK2_038757 [Sinanodonta woodiana]|uniref:NTR domain-containing protein n=1 Tax=Sinanodonta woodiana TaxID=1069815 RepID=A0ABD3WD38_SINWO
MDRPVIFIQFLLMLVVAVNALPDCECGNHDKMKHAVCMQQTLIMANPESARYVSLYRQHVDNPEDSYFTIYTMKLTKTYKDGYTRLGDESIFELIAPTPGDDCGVALDLQTDYFIAGTSMNDTLLMVHGCDYIERVPWTEKTAAEMEEMNGFLTRQTQVDCSDFCVLVTDFGSLIAC